MMSPAISLCVLLVSCLAFTSTKAKKEQDVAGLEELDDVLLNSFTKTKTEHTKGKDVSEVEAEVSHLINTYSKHVRDSNCGAIIQMFHPDYMLILDDGSLAKGLEAMQVVLDVLKSIGSTNMTTLAVSPLGRNAKYVFQHVREVASDHQGNILYAGEAFLIWKRHHGSLKIRLEMYEEE